MSTHEWDDALARLTVYKVVTGMTLFSLVAIFSLTALDHGITAEWGLNPLLAVLVAPLCYRLSGYIARRGLGINHLPLVLMAGVMLLVLGYTPLLAHQARPAELQFPVMIAAAMLGCAWQAARTERRIDTQVN